MAEGDERDWARWMQAACAGDRVQYRKVLDALVPLVTAVARNCLIRNGRDDTDLEDIVQESFLAIHLKRHMWDASRPLVPWIRALVVNKTVDSLRRKGHRITVPIEDFEEVLPQPVAEPDLSAEEIEALITNLQGRQRQVLEAVALKGMTVAQAAENLGMSEGTARVTLHRGLKVLARIYRNLNA